MLVLTNSRPKEATELLDAGVVKANNITRTVFNQTHGFACCSARQSVQRRIVDSDRVSFFATVHSSAEGSGIHNWLFGDRPTVVFDSFIFSDFTSTCSKAMTW